MKKLINTESAQLCYSPLGGCVPCVHLDAGVGLALPVGLLVGAGGHEQLVVDPEALADAPCRTLPAQKHNRAVAQDLSRKLYSFKDRAMRYLTH